MKPIQDYLNPAAVMCRWLTFVCLLLIWPIGHAQEVSVRGVDAVGITVSDLDRALEFYTQALPFKKLSQREVHGSDYERLFGVFGMRARIARLQLGEEQIELIEYLAPQGRPVPVDGRSNDEWFQHIAIIVRDMDKAYQHLRKYKVKHASTGPQTLPDRNPNAGGIKAFYFKDPDGNHLEILQFPKGKGDPRWHKPTDRLFLGIDHTAIVVNDTEQALHFYRDGLGLRVQGHSENYGIEQERLNNVFGARLRITSLKGQQGPAIEFLEYLSPSNGRPMPVDTAANDLWHWQIVVKVDNLTALIDAVQASGGHLVSPGSVAMEQALFKAGMLVRGPNGHALLLINQ